jgi:hypothetical protein
MMSRPRKKSSQKCLSEEVAHRTEDRTLPDGRIAADQYVAPSLNVSGLPPKLNKFATALLLHISEFIQRRRPLMVIRSSHAQLSRPILDGLLTRLTRSSYWTTISENVVPSSTQASYGSLSHSFYPRVRKRHARHNFNSSALSCTFSISLTMPASFSTFVGGNTADALARNFESSSSHVAGLR